MPRVNHVLKPLSSRDYFSGLLERPATVIHHGIDTETFTPAADHAALRRRLGLPQDGLLVGCYGRIRDGKGTGDFVQAMIALVPKRPHVTALVMGRATRKHQAYLAELQRQVAAAGLSHSIRFLPEVPVDCMADWYRVLDLYVAPQRWEGFGLTPLEAMASGVPVVATRVGAFQEPVTSQTGSLIAPQDPVEMAETVAAWLDDTARLSRAGQAARRHVQTNHTIETEARALVAVYEQLLEKQ